MTEFLSSMIRFGDYNKTTKCLTIVFNKGGTFIYSGVPSEVWRDMLESESVGKFFLSDIKGKYDGRKLDDALPPQMPVAEHPLRGETVDVTITDANKFGTDIEGKWPDTPEITDSLEL